MGANVFATAENDTHRRLLMERLNIAEDHVLSSACDVKFSKTLVSHTKGKGADVIVNTLSNATIEVLVGCLANFGRFVNVTGKMKVPKTGVSAHNVSLFSVDVAEMEVSAPSKLATIFAQSWNRPKILSWDNLHPRRIHIQKMKRLYNTFEVRIVLAALHSLSHPRMSFQSFHRNQQHSGSLQKLHTFSPVA